MSTDRPLAALLCPCNGSTDGYAPTCTVHPAPRWYLDRSRLGGTQHPPPALEVYDELHLTGQPPHGYPPYSAVVRSDADDPSIGTPRWSQLQSVARLALGLQDGQAWTDVQVRRRHVEIRRQITGWQDITKTMLAEAAKQDGDRT